MVDLKEEYEKEFDLKKDFDFSNHTHKKNLRLGKTEIMVAKLKAIGESDREIAEKVGKSHGRVYQIRQRDDIKAMIEEEQTRLASLVPRAVDNFKSYIDNATLSDDKTDKEMGFRATQKLLESTGILNNQPSHLVQILYNDNKTIISPVIEALMGNFMEKFKSLDSSIESNVGSEDRISTTDNEEVMDVEYE
jgi:hypothetical protein